MIYKQAAKIVHKFISLMQIAGVQTAHGPNLARKAKSFYPATCFLAKIQLMQKQQV